MWPDGTGEPNKEGIKYYNCLIDALLEKGYSKIYSGMLSSNIYISSIKILALLSNQESSLL